MSLRQSLFRFLARCNKILLPRISAKDLNKLGKMDKLIVAWRYWVTTNSLD